MYYLLWSTLAIALYNKILAMCFASLTVPSTCRTFECIESFMSKKYNGRQLEIDNESRVNIARNTITWINYKNTLLGVLRSVDERTASVCIPRRTYIIWAFRRTTLEDFLTHVNNNDNTKVEVRTSCAYDWNIQSHPLRPIDSIVSSAPILEMIEDAQKFISEKQRYLDLGIPYRRGYLLDGPPGTGKSTCAVCLAGQLNRPLCYMSLTGKHANDEWLMEMLCRVPEGAVVLFDDYDRFTSTENGITITGFLNALDGVVAQTGKIIILVANDSSNINPALLRAGRIDRRFTFRLSTKKEAKALFERFYGKEHADLFEKNLKEDAYVPAELISHFMTHESAEEAASKN